jgi:hypothetical protein
VICSQSERKERVRERKNFISCVSAAVKCVWWALLVVWGCGFVVVDVVLIFFGERRKKRGREGQTLNGKRETGYLLGGVDDFRIRGPGDKNDSHLI